VRIASRWYGITAGIVAGILLAISPLLWEYAQEVRAYVAVPLIALMLLAGAEAFLRLRTKIPLKLWAFILITELAGLYTHNLVVPIVVWLNLVVIGVLGWRSISPHPLSPSAFASWRGEKVLLHEGEGFRMRAKLFSWLVAQAILFLFYIPWLLTQSPSGTTLNTVPGFNRDLLHDLWQGYFFPVAANDPPAQFWTLISFLAAILVGAILLIFWRGRSLKNGLLISQAILLPIFSTLLLIRASIDFHPRYYVLAVPALLLIFAAGIAALPKPSQAGTAVFIMGLAGLISYHSLNLIADHPRYQHDNFRAIAEYYEGLPADSIILIPYSDEPTLAMYYRDHLDIQAKIVLLPLHSSPQEAIERINAVLTDNPVRVELLTWFQVPADERGMYGCLLASHSDGTPTYFETFGLASNGYVIDQKLALQPIDSLNQFQGALQLTGMHYSQNATGQLCLQTDWTLIDPIPDTTYSAAARILNPFGWDLAGRDSLITRDDQARVESWQVGDQGAAFSLLELPPGTPAGEFAALLRLYSPQEMSGWDVLNPQGQSLGKDLRFNLEIVGVAGEFQQPALHRDNSKAGQLDSGQRLQVEFVNTGSPMITLIGQDWQLEQAIPPQNGLQWAEFQIPAEAAGEAVLQVGEAQIAAYTIQYIERILTPPAIDIPVNTAFPGVGTLAGVNLTNTEITPSEPLELELIWQAAATSPLDYTVFIQLLTPDGRLLGQVDAQPIRPTSSWLTGEYLPDSHQLHRNALEYKGEATLIVGLYNPQNAERIILADGTSYATVPVQITVR